MFIFEEFGALMRVEFCLFLPSAVKVIVISFVAYILAHIE